MTGGQLLLDIVLTASSLQRARLFIEPFAIGELFKLRNI